MTQIVNIDNYWQGLKFCCPACGSEVFTANGEPAAEPCEHVVFSWIGDADEFYNPSQQVERMITKAGKSDEFYPSPYEEDFQQTLPDNTVMFALTEHGMACGPVSWTVVHAIEFPEAEEF